MNLLNQYDQFSHAIPGSTAHQGLRAKALEFLKEKGLPTRRDEEWKYTSVKLLNDEKFVPAGLQATAPSHETLKEIQAKLNPAFTNIVFHNGVLNKTLSAVDELPAGVTLRESSELVSADAFQDAFEALSAAYFTRNYILDVKGAVSVEKPVNFVFFTSLEEGSAVMTHPRMTLQVGARSSLKFIESYYGQKDARYFTNPLIQVNVLESGKLSYVRLQAESLRAIHIGRTQFDLGKGAQLHSLVFATGAQLSRHNLVSELKSHDVHAVIDGVYVTRGSQHVDNTTVIDHQVGDCNTSQHYKGILADQSRGVFNGKVVIRKGAQKANSEQLNNNLLLSREAEADSKPQLEIYADDVKAAHGSTMGQLNQDELFYMESRAISRDVAIPMLSFGYASELIYKLENEVMQKWLTKELQEAFQGLQVAVTLT